MEYSKRHDDKMLSIISKQREKLAFIHENSILVNDAAIKKSLNLLDYIEENISLRLYTVPTLMKATQSEDIEGIGEIVRYFGGGYSKLFDIHYCYYIDDNYVKISDEVYLEYKHELIEPTDEDGKEIEDFDPNNLTFYCILNNDE